MARGAKVEPTEDWGQLELLLTFPEQVAYERIRPPVVFGASVAERSRQTGTPESTLRRKIAAFEKDGMRSLFESERIEPRGAASLDPEVRRLILDLKADHPPMRNNEIATICYVRFGRRPHGRTVGRVLRENPASISMFRRFEAYHEIEDATERRLAIVTLHSEGWNTKSIASYLKTSRPTVYRTLEKWIAEGVYGLEDRPRGAARKVDLRAMNEVRKLQENPELGEFRVSAALARIGIHLSPRTCGRILAVNRELYGLKKPKRDHLYDHPLARTAPSALYELCRSDRPSGFFHRDPGPARRPRLGCGTDSARPAHRRARRLRILSLRRSLAREPALAKPSGGWHRPGRRSKR